MHHIPLCFNVIFLPTTATTATTANCVLLYVLRSHVHRVLLPQQRPRLDRFARSRVYRSSPSSLRCGDTFQPTRHASEWKIDRLSPPDFVGWKCTRCEKKLDYHSSCPLLARGIHMGMTPSGRTFSLTVLGFGGAEASHQSMSWASKLKIYLI